MKPKSPLQDQVIIEIIEMLQNLVVQADAKIKQISTDDKKRREEI